MSRVFDVPGLVRGGLASLGGTQLVPTGFRSMPNYSSRRSRSRRLFRPLDRARPSRIGPAIPGRVQRIVRQLRAELKREIVAAERSISGAMRSTAFSIAKPPALALGSYILARRAGRIDLAERFAPRPRRSIAPVPCTARRACSSFRPNAIQTSDSHKLKAYFHAVSPNPSLHHTENTGNVRISRAKNSKSAKIAKSVRCVFLLVGLPPKPACFSIVARGNKIWERNSVLRLPRSPLASTCPGILAEFATHGWSQSRPFVGVCPNLMLDVPTRRSSL